MVSDLAALVQNSGLNGILKQETDGSLIALFTL
jgi:hypothetical protein